MKIVDQSDQLLVLRGTSIVGDFIVLGVALAVTAFGIAALMLGTFAALIPVGFAVVLGGLAFWAVHHRTEVRFDKEAGEFFLRRKMLHKVFEKRLSLEKIIQADVDLKRDRHNNNHLHPRYSYRLCIVTGKAAARERVPVGHGYSNNRRHKILAEQINTWLGATDAPVGHGPGLEDIRTAVSALGLSRAGD